MTTAERSAQAFNYFQHLSHGFAPNPLALPSRIVQFHPPVDRDERVNMQPATGQLVGRQSFTQGAIWVEGLLRRRGHLLPVRTPLVTRKAWFSPYNSYQCIFSDAGPWNVVPGLLSQANTWGLVEALTTIPDDHGLAEWLRPIAESVIEETFAGSPSPRVNMKQFGVWRDAHASANPAALQTWIDRPWWKTAFNQLYTSHPAPIAVPQPARPLQSPLPLNTQQEEIVRAGSANAMTVVSGPPGTGKTHLVTAIALQQFKVGKSTLIATGSEAAADSIEEMLAAFPMVTAIRFGADANHALLGNQLAEGIPGLDSTHSTLYTNEELAKIDRQLAKYEEQLVMRLQATRASEGPNPPRSRLPEWLTEFPESSDAESLLQVFAPSSRSTKPPRGRWVRGVMGRRKLGAPLSTSRQTMHEALTLVQQILVAEAPLEEATAQQLWADIERTRATRATALGHHLEALRRERTTVASRRTLGQLAAALREPSAVDRQDAIGRAPLGFVDAVPLWFGTLEHVDGALPPVPAMFDLVVVDEASQASQLRGASALLRAKRATIIGDPRQIRHEPTSTEAERVAAMMSLQLSPAMAAELDESTISLFDAAAQQAPVHRLREHFRSSPHIIGFSNERFYGEDLKMMTQHPGRESRDCIHDITTRDTVNADGHLVQEIRAVSAEIEKLAGFGARSIGVVGGHPAHTDALRAHLDETLSLPLRKRISLRVGTPQEFQGIERDTIIISPGIHSGNLHLLEAFENPNAFNVAVTRAHRDVYVISAMHQRDMPDGLLRDYLAWSHQPPEAFSTHVDAHGWQGWLANELASLGDLRVIVDYPVGGHTVDLALGSGRMAIGVETHVHPDGVEAHIERHLALRRAGWKIVDAFESDWRTEKPECVSWLAALAAGT